jgi:NAD(P)-dependent dehydrogenase (short-subunit alcohol dehydrogenase family)
MGDGTVTIIVGGTGSLGRHVCHDLAERGHELLIVGTDPQRGQDLIHKLGAGAQWLQADVRSEDDTRRLAGWLAERDLSVRMLVYLAAGQMVGGIDSAPVEQILDAVDVKVGGLLRVLRALKSSLTSESTVVVIGGDLAYEPSSDASAAGIANAALANCVRQLQWPLGHEGIRIHLVAPGPIASERLHALARRRAESRGDTAADVLADLTAASSLKRLTAPEEIAWLVSTLADPRAAALHGTTVIANSGRRVGLP